MEVITGYGFPYVSASLYGDAGNFEIQAGVLAQVTWTDAPPAADYYEFTLRLHTDKFILLIGTATDDTDGISVDWLIPEHTSGDLRASAYFSDGREVHSAAIDVYSYKAVPEGACVLRSHTIIPLSVYQSPSDTGEIIGVMYPAAMLETVGKNSNGWYKIKTDDVNAAGAFEQKIGPGTAWLYESFTELFGACENLSVLETEIPEPAPIRLSTSPIRFPEVGIHVGTNPVISPPPWPPSTLQPRPTNYYGVRQPFRSICAAWILSLLRWMNG